MLGPGFWNRARVPEQGRGNGPRSSHQKGRATSPAAAGTACNDPRFPRPCSAPTPSGHSACRIRRLKENCPCDKKLRALKKMILAQRHKCASSYPENGTPRLPFEREPWSTKPLKRKVCKVAFSAPACPGRSERAGKKLRTSRHAASLSRKAEKERAVTFFGVSAWREGQKLARNVLGPPQKYLNLKNESKSKGMEPLRASQPEQSFREKGQALQPEMRKTKQERHGPNLRWQDRENNGWTQKWTRRHQKAPATEKKNGNHPRSAGRVRTAGSTRVSSDGLKATHSPVIQNAPAKTMGVRETARPCKGRLDGPSPRRSETPRKEGRPTTATVEARKKPYSPEQVREFMDQKAAERNRRIQEERRASKQAQEEKNEKLQEVYRKQREAVRRRSRCTEQLREDMASITPTRNNLDLRYSSGPSPAKDDTRGVPRTSRPLLRKKTTFNSIFSRPPSMVECRGCELDSRMDKTGQWTPTLGLDTSMDPEGQLRSCPKLKQVETFYSRASHHTLSPFHLWRGNVNGMETPFSSDIATSPSSRRKQDRVKAIHNLAKDLSERLGREMERLQATKTSGNQGCPPGTPFRGSQMASPPGASLEKFDAPENAESTWGLLNPPMCPVESACLENGLGIAPTVKERILQHLPPTEVRQMDSVERRQRMIEAEDLNEGFAPEMGFGEKDPPGAPAGVFPGSGPIHTVVETPQASLKKDQPEGSNPRKKPPENQPGQDARLFPAQHQPSDFPSLSVDSPPGKTSPADLSEPTDSNSQWSEVGRFYGGSRSFGRLSLTLVEQSLREEELRARHQGALLRLRGEALREKAQAELAWLEHGQRSPNGSRGTGGPSSTAEKQRSILTRLKQEQAEIRHLQNIGRAAHQERKLLLQQQKELLEVRKTTTQLWLQLAGQRPRQISENDNTPGAGTLEKEKFETSFKTGPLSETCSGGTEGRSCHEADRKHLAASKDALPTEDREAEGLAEWKPGKGDPSKDLEAAIQNLYDPSGERSQNPALGGGRTADRSASRGEKEHDNGLTKASQEVHPGSPLDKGPEGFLPAGASSIRHGFCPYPEKSPSGLEFRKGYAVLVHLSGSSPSPSDLEEDGLEDTDVSLPDEFVLQEPLPDHPGTSTHHGTPAVPRTPENTLSSSEKKSHGQISGGHLESKELWALLGQEKTWEPEKLVESGSVVLSNSERPRGREKDHVHTPTLRSSATPMNISEESSFAENGGNETASRSPVDPGMVFSSTDDPCQSPEGEGEQVPSLNVIGDEVEDENISRFGDKDATATPAPDVSLNIGAPQDSEAPVYGPKHSLCHGFPNSSDHRSTDAHVSHKPDETSLQLDPTPLSNSWELAEENRNGSPPRNQNTDEAGMVTVRSSSPQEGLLTNEGGAMCLRNKLLSELEDDVVSPIDELLTYGSSDLPSSTEKDFSSWGTDLPAPPENLSGSDDEANSGLLDFPSPPDPVVSSEAEGPSPPCKLPEGGLGPSPHA